MTQRRIILWAVAIVSGGLAIIGFMVFVVGVLIEFLDMSPIEDANLSPTIQIALAGLFLSGFMLILGFALVMFLLALQTRKQAPGYGEAYHFVETLQFQRAIPLLEKALEQGRETADVLSLLASAYAYNGQLAKAQAIADRAVQRYPNDANVYMVLANAYRLQASYEEAARALQIAVSMSPHQSLIWAELGLVQMMAGDKANAFEAFKQAAQAPLPAMYSVRVYYHLAKVYADTNDKQAEKDARDKILEAASGLSAWKPLQEVMANTAYGQALGYEIRDIEKALAEATSATME